MRYLIFLAALPLLALDPRLTNPVFLNGGAHASWCGGEGQTGCPAHGYILYDVVNPATGCFQIHSMDSDGTHDTNLSGTTWGLANLSAKNQGAAVYSPDSSYIMFTQQKSTSNLACANQLANPGYGVDHDVVIADAAFASTKVAVTTITSGLSQGNLRPRWTRDGAKIWYDHYFGLSDLGLRYATYTAGNPPTVGSNTRVNPTGSNNDSPEPADTYPGEATTCNLIYTAIPASIIAYPTIRQYNICTSTDTQIYGDGAHYVEFWSIRPTTQDTVLFESTLMSRGNAGTDIYAAAVSGTAAMPLTCYDTAACPSDYNVSLVNPSSGVIIATQPTWSPDGNSILLSLKLSTTSWQLWKYTWSPSKVSSTGSVSHTGQVTQ